MLSADRDPGARSNSTWAGIAGKRWLIRPFEVEKPRSVKTLSGLLTHDYRIYSLNPRNGPADRNGREPSMRIRILGRESRSTTRTHLEKDVIRPTSSSSSVAMNPVQARCGWLVLQVPSRRRLNADGVWRRDDAKLRRLLASTRYFVVRGMRTLLQRYLFKSKTSSILS